MERFFAAIGTRVAVRAAAERADFGGELVNENLAERGLIGDREACGRADKGQVTQTIGVVEQAKERQGIDLGLDGDCQIADTDAPDERGRLDCEAVCRISVR